MPAPALVAAIDQLDPATYSGAAYRHVASHYNPLSGAGARSQGGRWNPKGSYSTLYLARERATAIAEFQRMASRAGRAPADFLPRRLYTYRLRLNGLLDLTDPDALAAVDLTAADLSSDDLSRCQAVGEAAQHLGREGVIAPSATTSGTVIAVFFDRLDPESAVEAPSYELWEAPTS